MPDIAVAEIPVDEEEEDKDDGMEVEQPEEFDEPEAETSLIIGEQEVEAMVGLDDSEAETEDTAKVAATSKPPRIWPEVSTDRAARYRREVDAIREVSVLMPCSTRPRSSGRLDAPLSKSSA